MENVSVIILRDGKELQEPRKSREVELELEVKGAKLELNIDSNQTTREIGEKKREPYKPIPLFPSRFRNLTSKVNEANQEILETLNKVEINIPLLDAIKQVPRYAKFLKELCTTKRKLVGNEKISVGENVSAVFQRKFPLKCKDPGVFSVPCNIRYLYFDKAMLDLGASINVMPRSVYDKLNLGELKKTGVVFQLADRSSIYPDGVLENVLAQVNELVFCTDFYVMNMGDACHDIPILLGRPFLKTAKTKIDVHEGTLTMKFDGEVIIFNIFDAMRFPADVSYVYALDTIAELPQDIYDLSNEDEFLTMLTKRLDQAKF